MACVIVRVFPDPTQQTQYWDTALNSGAGGWTTTLGSATSYADIYAAATDAERQVAAAAVISYIKIRDQVAQVDHQVPTLT